VDVAVLTWIVVVQLTQRVVHLNVVGPVGRVSQNLQIGAYDEVVERDVKNTEFVIFFFIS